jgi:hypothetical protein
MIIDNNFLTNEEKTSVRDLILGPEVAWYLNTKTCKQDDISYSSIIDKNTQEHFQFTHTLRRELSIESRYYDYLHNNVFVKFLNKHNIQCSTVLRAKLNLVTPLETDLYQSPHVDYIFPHSVFLYYVNDSDGNTLLFNEKHDGTKKELTLSKSINPEMGKAIFFDGLTYHAPTAPKQSAYRAVINIAFV